jgi:hypothetical protein
MAIKLLSVCESEVFDHFILILQTIFFLRAILLIKLRGRLWMVHHFLLCNINYLKE